jgi:hypothetical protein
MTQLETTNMMLVLTTQYMENYGDAENPYWKYKGGNDYKVLNAPTDPKAIQELVAKVQAKIELDTAFTREYLIGHALMQDDALTFGERDQLEYDGKITYPAEVFDANDFV